jgi:hypothetical protein
MHILCMYIRLKYVSNSNIIITKVGDIMSVFDCFYDKEKLIRKTVEIDNDLYDKLSEILKGKYNTSVNMLINASIEELIKTENINLYAKEDKYSTMKRSLLIKESFSNGLNKLKEKYNISISKLINMAIKNAVNS